MKRIRTIGILLMLILGGVISIALPLLVPNGVAVAVALLVLLFEVVPLIAILFERVANYLKQDRFIPFISKYAAIHDHRA